MGDLSNLGGKNALPAAIGVVVLYSLATCPLSSALLSFGAAFIWYGFTQSLPAVLLIVLIPVAIGLLNKLTKPVGRFPAPSPSLTGEGFQANADPITVHQRVEEIKRTQPREAGSPSGVLESPEILDNAPLEGFQDTGAAAPMVSSSAAVTGPLATINPPAEYVVPALGIQERPLRSNHALTEDDEAEETALVKTGTGLPDADQPAVMAGISAGTSASVQ